MKVYSIPATVRGVIFDIDNTLYKSDAYVASQNDVLIERLARERGESIDAVAALVADYRSSAAAGNGGRIPSLGNTFLHFGIPISVSVSWREEAMKPEAHLQADPELDTVLAVLASKYRLICVTNNPRSIGLRTLRALGISHNFRGVIGLDDTLVSKPDPRPFELAARRLELAPATLVSVGDRYEVDLEPAISLGMGAILVETREDLLNLPLD